MLQTARTRMVKVKIVIGSALFVLVLIGGVYVLAAATYGSTVDRVMH